MSERIALSKKTRFEVFKRDSFKCQYCGASAPDVILQVDHIRPVIDGGRNELLNLVTACEGCNQGKGARLLTDATAITKSRTQLENLQLRRDQLEMLMEWQRGLTDLDALAMDRISEFFTDLCAGHAFLSEIGVQNLRKLVKRFGIALTMDALRTAIDHYGRYVDGKPTSESIEHALRMVGGICTRKKEEIEHPELVEPRKIQNVLRRRDQDEFGDWRTWAAIKAAHLAGVSDEEMWVAANASRTLRHLRDNLDCAIEEA